jgi:hypothetical protein
MSSELAQPLRRYLEVSQAALKAAEWEKQTIQN